jgi:hypothetical protein
MKSTLTITALAGKGFTGMTSGLLGATYLQIFPRGTRALAEGYFRRWSAFKWQSSPLSAVGLDGPLGPLHNSGNSALSRGIRHALRERVLVDLDPR